jgi:hypothetical protein
MRFLVQAQTLAKLVIFLCLAKYALAIWLMPNILDAPRSNFKLDQKYNETFV